jgi:hypothetical protein
MTLTFYCARAFVKANRQPAVDAWACPETPILPAFARMNGMTRAPTCGFRGGKQPLFLAERAERVLWRNHR